MDAALFSGAIIIAIVARQASANRLERNNKKSVKTIEELKRYDLSIAHKACNFYQMDELVWNHISARHEDGWLITPGRMMWDVINPSDIVAASDNCTADIIHSAVYKVRPDVKAIIHLHTKYAAAVACIETGFIPLTQDGSFFFEKVATHEWEGVSDDPIEGERIGKAVLAVPNCNILLMPNHGFCTFASTVKEAFVQAFYFEKACETQVLAMSTRSKLFVPPAEIMKKSEMQNYSDLFRPGECEWDAVVDLVERKYGMGD